MEATSEQKQQNIDQLLDEKLKPLIEEATTKALGITVHELTEDITESSMTIGELGERRLRRDSREIRLRKQIGLLEGRLKRCALFNERLKIASATNSA